MYYYGGGLGCCTIQTSYYYPVNYGNISSNYAIILVLFILLVIIIGTNFTDGLDVLLSSFTMVIAIFYIFVCLL